MTASASLVDDIMAVRETAAASRRRRCDGRTRAFVQVQNGCDHRCTFCIIPYGRGNSRSVPMGAVVEQVRGSSSTATREVVLTGVDITSYGATCRARPGLGLLVKAILRHVPELGRLRLSSIDSVEADDALLDAVATERRLMPHLHLSLQAGDDLVLKRMKRRHLRADAIRFCETVRALRPDIVLGADIIAGFPTETEAMFPALALDRRGMRPDASPRLPVLAPPRHAGRPHAAGRRAPRSRTAPRRLREAGAAALARHLAAEVGARRRILVETGRLGRTEAFTPVRFAHDVPAGTIVEATIAGHDGKELLAA